MPCPSCERKDVALRRVAFDAGSYSDARDIALAALAPSPAPGHSHRGVSFDPENCPWCSPSPAPAHPEPRQEHEERAKRWFPQRCEYKGPFIVAPCEHPTCHDTWNIGWKRLAAEFAAVAAEERRS